jgi:hypothetical protein
MLSAQTIKNHHSDIFTFLHGHLNEIRRNLKRVMKHLHLSEIPQDDCAHQSAHGDDAAES